MIKEIKQKADQFKSFVTKIRNDHFPHKQKEVEIEEVIISTEPQTQEAFSYKVVLFWAIGLGFVIIGYLMYHTMEYLYLLIAAYVISLALEGVVGFFSKLTRRRGIGILITYLLVILFLTSGFIIVVPFLLHQGTEILNLITQNLQEIQQEISQQGLEGYLTSLHRLPEFVISEIIRYVSMTDTNSVLQTISNNIGNIMSMSSLYLKLLGGYAMNVVGRLFASLGKVVLFLILSVFFSLSHFEVKNALKYVLRRTKQSRTKIDDVYGGVANWLKAQILMCFVIGVTTYLGLWILHLIGFALPQKGTLAVLAGIFEVLPYL